MLYIQINKKWKSIKEIKKTFETQPIKWHLTIFLSGFIAEHFAFDLFFSDCKWEILKEKAVWPC